MNARYAVTPCKRTREVQELSRNVRPIFSISGGKYASVNALRSNSRDHDSWLIVKDMWYHFLSWCSSSRFFGVMNLLSEVFKLVQTVVSTSFKAFQWALKDTYLEMKEWYPMNLLDVQEKFALIILNQPLLVDKHYISQLWNKAILTATVDGGTIEWLKIVKCMEKSAVTHSVPDLVTGDFDSVPTELLDHLRSLGAKVIPTPDQNETDFKKCIRSLSEELGTRNLKVNCVVALVEMTGRFDHIMSNVSVLFEGPRLLEMPLFQLSSDSLNWVLESGRHTIHIDERVFDRWCGFIPFGKPACVTTSGFKWDMIRQRLEFGVFISTSNQFTNEPVVTVETDHPLLFTMGLPPH